MRRPFFLQAPTSGRGAEMNLSPHQRATLPELIDPLEEETGRLEEAVENTSRL